MSTADANFEQVFKALTGDKPFPWQTSLYTRFEQGDLPDSCSIPTGLGKTRVLAIWLIALAKQMQQGNVTLPRRLVYVVNRRTVVDQTTAEAEKLRDRLAAPEKHAAKPEHVPLLKAIAAELGSLCAIQSDAPLAISTLRGQFADNREWSADPSRPAIVIGTVDMIGSRLLFSGYGIGSKSRPLHAGFLGQDALLVHDEAHLEPAFQRLVETIVREQRCQEPKRRSNNGSPGDLPWPMLRVMALSATNRNGNGANRADDGDTRDQEPFTLEEDDRTHAIVKQRIEAVKRLELHPADESKVALDVAAFAAQHKDANVSVLVFVRTLKDVSTVEKELIKTKRPVILLTGTMRGLERDQLVEQIDFKRFLKGATKGETVYLVCTSAGEVGIDISANHMVCDLSTFESMAQRLGRVNRYGEGNAQVDVVHPVSFGKVDKKSGELKADEIDIRRQRTLGLLRKLPVVATDPEGKNQFDASAKALMDLRDRKDLPCKIDDAFAPIPAIPPATDILFDAWAMTSITEKLPGRPPVEPYLHGIEDDAPQTTLAWRAEIDLLELDDLNDEQLAQARKTLQAILSKHRIRPHETITTAHYHVEKFFTNVVKAGAKMGDRHVADRRVALVFPGGNVEFRRINEINEDPGILKTEPTILLPASLDCLADGMLNADRSKNRPGDEQAAVSHDVADHPGYEPVENVPTRFRLLIERSDETWTARAMPLGQPLPEGWNMEPAVGSSTKLVNQIKQQAKGLRVNLIQPLSWDEEGDPTRAMVCLAPAPKRDNGGEQTLANHVTAVEIEAHRLAEALNLSEPFRSALLFAAKWHDEGKKARIWQRYIGGPDPRKLPDAPPLGKSADWRDPKILNGYRHEFGSLLRISDQQLLSDVDARDLALHLIAAHHGSARPHFAHSLDYEYPDAQCNQIQLETIRRYARLQRKYGRWGLAYLESLLRAADWAASQAAGQESGTDDSTDSAMGDQ